MTDQTNERPLELISSREFKRTKLSEFENSLPSMIQAREIVKLEINRLINDPLTGEINEDIVM